MKIYHIKQNCNYKTIKNYVYCIFFATGCPVFKKALFKQLGIRNCVVRLGRLNDSNSPNLPKKKLLPSEEKLRKQISWLPTSASVVANSSHARNELADYKEKNGIEPAVARKNVLRLRAKSMFQYRSNDVGQISELEEKFSKPNFGLKPSDNRLLKQQPKQPLTDFQKLLVEFKQRADSKSGKK